MPIPDIANSLEKTADELLPLTVAEQTIEEELEEKPFLISYRMYNNKLCEINQTLVKNCQRKALGDLKIIGNEIFDFKEFPRKNIDKIPVRREGEYRKLFNRLHEDVELYEHKLQDTARIFYFVDEIHKIFYVVAITQTHYETDKVRR